MSGFVVTKEMLLTATDYIPLAQKEAFVERCAALCIDRLTLKTPDGKDAGFPPMYRADQSVKARCLMAALAGMYLRQALEMEIDQNGDGWAVSVDEYDRLAASHVFNQIQRFKSDAETKNKAFDLLEDYIDLEKRLNAEISSVLMMQNDAVMRSQQSAQAAMAKLPEVLEKLDALRAKGEADGA